MTESITVLYLECDLWCALFRVIIMQQGKLRLKRTPRPDISDGKEKRRCIISNLPSTSSSTFQLHTRGKSPIHQLPETVQDQRTESYQPLPKSQLLSEGKEEKPVSQDDKYMRLPPPNLEYHTRRTGLPLMYTPSIMECTASGIILEDNTVCFIGTKRNEDAIRKSFINFLLGGDESAAASSSYLTGAELTPESVSETQTLALSSSTTCSAGETKPQSDLIRSNTNSAHLSTGTGSRSDLSCVDRVHSERSASTELSMKKVPVRIQTSTINAPNSISISRSVTSTGSTLKKASVHVQTYNISRINASSMESQNVNRSGANTGSTIHSISEPKMTSTPSKSKTNVVNRVHHHQHSSSDLTIQSKINAASESPCTSKTEQEYECSSDMQLFEDPQTLHKFLDDDDSSSDDADLPRVNITSRMKSEESSGSTVIKLAAEENIIKKSLSHLTMFMKETVSKVTEQPSGGWGGVVTEKCPICNLSFPSGCTQFDASEHIAMCLSVDVNDFDKADVL